MQAIFYIVKERNNRKEEITILNEEQLSKVSGGVGMPTISTEWYTGSIFVYTIQKKIA